MTATALAIDYIPQSKILTLPSYQPKPSLLVMSYEEFLAWTDEDTHAEWVPLDSNGHGEVIIHMSAKDVHQTVLVFLDRLLGLFVNLFDVGKLHVAPFEMKLKPGGSSREPDILFIAKENLGRLTNDRLNGPADLVIEIVSLDSVKRDRQQKFKEYCEAGVREYWIIDPRVGRYRADFYRLDETGQYQLFATEEDERVDSLVLAGFWLHPDWLWQADSRDPWLTFCEIAGLSESLVKQVQEQLQAGFKRNVDSAH